MSPSLDSDAQWPSWATLALLLLLVPIWEALKKSFQQKFSGSVSHLIFYLAQFDHSPKTTFFYILKEKTVQEVFDFGLTIHAQSYIQSFH